MVLHSVRCVLTFLVVALRASSLAALWPNSPTRWLLRNGRAFGPPAGNSVIHCQGALEYELVNRVDRDFGQICAVFTHRAGQLSLRGVANRSFEPWCATDMIKALLQF